MKINKTISYALATSLLFGGTFLGTKAAFIDEKTSTNSLTLNAGNFKILVKENNWVKNAEDRNNDKIIDARDDVYDQGCEMNTDGVFNNVKPGDTFTRYINVLNCLNESAAKISIKEKITGNKPELMKYIDVDFTNFNRLSNDNFQIAGKTNTGGFIHIKIEDTPDAWKAFNGQSLKLDDVYTITATQVD